MKKIVVVLFCCLPLSLVFAQETSEYVKIILDGKEAYMSSTTGEIFKTLPTSKIKKQNTESSPTTAPDMNTVDGIHVVVKGETLYRIAKHYGTSVAALQQENGLTSNAINVGQTLRIPILAKTTTTPTFDGEIHEVQKGDTLYSISKKNNISVAELQRLNGLTSTHITIGQVLKLQ